MTSATGWREVKINQLGRVVTGKTPPSAKPELFGSEHPFITPTDIDGISRTVVTDRFISVGGVAAFKNQVIPQGTVCFVCIGATIGKMCIATRLSLTNQQVNSIIVDETLHDPKFVFYALRDLAKDIKGLAGGAATPIISKSSFSDITMNVAPLEQQRRIGLLLSAYDDLIENNTRRIAILEEIARRLYEEWFVRFRFPGHEGSATTEGLPAGWSRTTLGSITTKIGSGATPRGGKSAYFDSGVTLIRSQNIFDYNFVDKGLAFLDDDQAAQLQGVAVESDDVLLNITGASVARCCMVPRRHLPARVNQHVMLIRADSARMEPSYLLCAINSVEMKRQLLAYAQTGSTREALTREMMSQFVVLLPDPVTLRKFGEIAGDIFRQREILADKNANLRTTRDLLLPKLISGELDVSTLPEPQAEAV